MQEVKYKLVPVEPTDEMLAAAWGIDLECHNHHGPADVSSLGEIKAKEVWAVMLSEAPEQLSDLEIVQKALVTHGRNHVRLNSDGNWWTSNEGGSDMQSLLAWAKQTIGGL